MTERARQSGVVSMRAALAVTVGLAALVAVGIDAVPAAGAGIAGALAAGWGSGAVAGERKRRVAAGSVALVLGSVALLAGTVLVAQTDGAAYVVVLVGTTVAAVAASDGFDAEVISELYRTVSESGFVTVVSCIGFGLAAFLFGTGFAAALLRRALSLSTYSALVALWWLQVEVLCVGLLAERAARVVGRWAPTDAALDQGLAAQFRFQLSDVPRWYLVALAVQFVFATLAPDALAPFLAARPEAARAVEILLLSGATQIGIAAVAAALAAVSLCSSIQRAVVFWTGTSPGYTLAFAAGGLAGAVGALAVGVLAVVGLAADGLAVVGSGTNFAAFGPALQALVGVFVSLLATAALILGAHVLVDGADPAGGGFSVSAVALLAGTLLLSNDLPAVAVVVGAAVCLFVWDVGVHAVGLDRDLGGVRPSTRTEVVHATAAGSALFGGVVVATAVGYFAVPLRIPDDRAMVALVLVLCSFVAFAFAVRR
ncbi:hypothetical protein [Halosimplex sp. J119]